MEIIPNKLQTLINESFAPNCTTKVRKILESLYEKFDFSECILHRSHIDKLNKLCMRAEDILTQFSICVIYNLVFSQNLANFSELNPDLILECVNCMYVMTEKLNGMKIMQQLKKYMKELLEYLQKRQELSEESHN